MLQVGAVFGRSFLPAGVAAIDADLGAGGDEIVEGLLDRDLVRPASLGELAFRHILIREVAYGMLPRAERARLHGGAAGWLAARAAGQRDAYAELIAVHAREAATLATALGLDEAAGLRAEAVDRLEAAAESALAAGANIESLRHLRAALDFATPDRHLDLYERMGETTVHGDVNIGYLVVALDLARGSGAPPERILRIVSGILIFYTRWQGSVAQRPSEAELRSLLEEGRALLELTTDERIRAGFLLVESFMPFWIEAEGRAPTPEELERADRSGREVLATGDRLHDASLMSAALDGLGSVAQLRGDYAQLRATALKRLDLGDRLSVAERIDAACMVAWNSLSTGELEEAETVVGAAFALIPQGQASNWSLHLTAWRIVIAAVRGDWDLALASADKAHGRWLELDREATGYAIRGFLAALEVSRARHDDRAAAHWLEVIDNIISRFRTSSRRRLQALHAAGDASGIVAALEAAEYGSLSDDIIVQALAFASDRGVHLGDALLERLEARIHPGALLLIAQVDRARGIAHGDAAAFARALGVFEESGARPAAARVRCELGRLSGDDAMFAEGMKTLRQIGDLDQIERYT
jgi:hypothetical protein